MTAIIDLHADTPMLLRWGLDLAKHHHRLPRFMSFFSHADIPRLKMGGVEAQGWGLWSSPRECGRSVRSIEKQLAAVEKTLRRQASDLCLVRTGDDIEKARSEGRIGVFLGVEGAHCLNRDIALLGKWAARGVRYLTLAHFSENFAASPALGAGRPRRGLTEQGRDLVAEANRLAVIIDLAHVEREGFLEAAKTSRKPVMVSHTGVKGVFDHWRNIDDDQIKAIADSGGVVGIINTSRFLGPGGIETLVRHMLHAARIGGDSVVALGSDFDGMVKPVPGLDDASMWPGLLRALEGRGVKQDVIEAFASRNVLRVFRG